MQRYVVIDTNTNNRLLAPRNPAGRYHVAHCTSDLPQLERELQGPLPVVGFALLMGAEGSASRLIFSQINCGQRWALDQHHPGVVPA